MIQSSKHFKKNREMNKY